MPESEQDQLAAAIKAEIETGQEWGRLFAISQHELAQLADEALEDE